MKSVALLLATSALLLGCASAPKPEPRRECPKMPPLELAVQEQDWLGLMENFLRGTLPTPPDYRLTSKPASTPTIRLDAK